MAQYLPAELLRIIFTDINITHDDLKSLRLVSKSWTDHATDLLFHRICLSRLKKDRDAFFNIAARPHLAKCARVLVWYELGNDYPNWYLPDQPPDDDDHPDSLQSLDEDPDTQLFYIELASQITDLFWFSLQIAMHKSKSGSDAVNKEMYKLEDFMAQF
ncbi:uncharacterized protein F4807DRAFT_462297 [Annulohypoxylon truncatum]|uniref:uncharacterized protein n=1 Tax=Annulohypoxylon truncatum TaxID=327061 RepID=UPI002008E70B|nr:uncharacterized protein F4807DRAFT_462297 [Annulohypoxylon truncatum]KAI1207854.1 hypothetical protein F4807DRAFT_462297 [Annulohypoxylon truncatum]